jgi:hypothetical protein
MRMTIRSPISVQTSKFPAVVWALSLVAAITSVFALAAEIGPRVATHFDASGHANSWMSRGEHTAIFTVFILGFSSFAVAIGYGIRFFPPTLLNVPHAAYWRTKEHYAEACDFIFRHSFWLGAASAIWAALLNYLLVRANLSTPPQFSGPGISVLTVVYLGAVVAWIFPLVRFFQQISPNPRGQPGRPD